MPNLVMIGTMGWEERTPSLSPLPVLPFVGFFVCVFFAPRPGHTAGVDRFRRAMARSTCFPPRKCLLGVSMMKNNV